MHTEIAQICATSHQVSLFSLVQACICKGAEELDSGAHITKISNSKQPNTSRPPHQDMHCCITVASLLHHCCITKICNSKHTNQTNANATHPQQSKAQQRNALHKACKSKGLDSIMR